MPLSPPRPKGPPLNSLRAFEAAARKGGFTAAAEELSVTPAAVAQHIKTMEAWAGAPLFERRSQGVRLSPLGSAVLDDFSEAFDRLGEAVHKLRARASPSNLHVATLAAIAQCWLSPRLPDLRARFPEVTFSITALEHRPNPKRELFDFSLFFEDETSARAARMVILDRDRLVPVCAPNLARQLAEPDDLGRATFLHDATWAGDWDLWLRTAWPDHRIKTAGPTYSLYSLALAEAKAGAGVLIGHEALVRDALTDGSLVAPFPEYVATEQVLALAAAPSVRTFPPAIALIDALKELARPQRAAQV